MPAKKRPRNSTIQLPEIEIGSWRGEFIGTCRGNFGHVVQPGSPRRSVELTYLISPARLAPPSNSFVFAGVVMIMASALKAESPDAGALFKSDPLPSLNLALHVERVELSDMIAMFKEKRLKQFHFTIEAEEAGRWPLHSWGAEFEL